MEQLDKWQRELEKLSDRNYKSVDNAVFKYYREALIDVKKEIKAYLDAYDMLSFSKRLEVERLMAVADEIDRILLQATDSVNATITEYLQEEGKTGYYGVWYTMEQAENIQLNFPVLDREYIENLINNEIDGKRFSQRLYEHRDNLARRVTNEVQMATIQGKGYKEVAKKVNEQTEATYKQTLRIARTEGGRVQSTVKQKSYEEAKQIGVDIKKRWLSTLDKKTRHDHRKLDGQTVPVDGYFKVNGYKAKGPRLFGVAKEDINCRCTTIPIVNGIAPSVRLDNESRQTIKYRSYKQWAKAKGIEM